MVPPSIVNSTHLSCEAGKPLFGPVAPGKALPRDALLDCLSTLAKRGVTPNATDLEQFILWHSGLSAEQRADSGPVADRFLTALVNSPLFRSDARVHRRFWTFFEELLRRDSTFGSHDEDDLSPHLAAFIVRAFRDRSSEGKGLRAELRKQMGRAESANWFLMNLQSEVFFDIPAKLRLESRLSRARPDYTVFREFQWSGHPLAVSLWWFLRIGVHDLSRFDSAPDLLDAETGVLRRLAAPMPEDRPYLVLELVLYKLARAWESPQKPEQQARLAHLTRILLEATLDSLHKTAQPHPGSLRFIFCQLDRLAISLTRLDDPQFISPMERIAAARKALGVEFLSEDHIQANLAAKFFTVFGVVPDVEKVQIKRSLILQGVAYDQERVDSYFIPQLHAFLNAKDVPTMDKIEALSTISQEGLRRRELIEMHYPSARGMTGDPLFPYLFLWDVLGRGELPSGISLETDEGEEGEFVTLPDDCTGYLQ